jgi:hypothetical protein
MYWINVCAGEDGKKSKLQWQDIEFKDMKNLMINVLYFVKLFKVFAKMDLDNDGRIKLNDFTQVCTFSFMAKD